MATITPLKAAQEYALAKSDPAEFIDRFCLIKDENTGAVTRFRLWPYQRELLNDWVTHRLNVDLKARQLGISWLVCAFVLWLVNFYDNMTIVCVSKTQDKAWDLIAKVKFMYSNLPAHLRKETSKWNNGLVQFVGETEDGQLTDEGSRVLAIASTPGSGVGFTATVVVCDEWGEQDYAEELYSSIKPTIDQGGRFIGLGTGNSVGSFYHEICTKAELGEEHPEWNGFYFKFLGWWLRPGRHIKNPDGSIAPDMDWYTRTKAGYPNLQEFLRMYPSNPVESFIAAGGCPFSIEDLNWYQDNYVSEPFTAEYLEQTGWSERLVRAAQFNELWVWEKPRPGNDYMVVFDPATGKEDGGDYHAAHVLSLSNMEQVAEYWTRTDTDLACGTVLELARFYYDALLVWESTGVGAAATNYFVRTDYWNLYEHQQLNQERVQKHVRIKHNDKKAPTLGWPASRQANAIRDHELIGGIRDHALIIHSIRWLNEAKGFVRQADGSYAASGRAHDDLITSLGMGYHIALRRRTHKPAKSRPVRSIKKKAFRKERWN